MKKIIVLLSVFFLLGNLHAQVKNPVKWSFSAKKISADSYEVHLKATLDKGWHIYSQTTPDGGPVATEFTFTKNPLLTLTGKTKEKGTLEIHFEKLFGVDVKQFSTSVDFVQVVKVKGKIKTSLAGTVEYMLCNDKECLPPTETVFSVQLK